MLKYKIILIDESTEDGKVYLLSIQKLNGISNISAHIVTS